MNPFGLYRHANVGEGFIPSRARTQHPAPPTTGGGKPRPYGPWGHDLRGLGGFTLGSITGVAILEMAVLRVLRG